MLNKLRRPGAGNARRAVTDPSLSTGLGRDLLLLAAPLVIAILLGLAFATPSIYVMNASRSYVTGESLYSKSQKAAMIHLIGYSQNRDPREWDAYQQQIAITQSFGRAHDALTSEPPDFDIAAEALIAGGNHPDDVPGVIRLYGWGGWLAEMQDGIALWAAGDKEVDLFDEAAQRLHAALSVAKPDPASVEALLSEIRVIDERLTRLENGFSTVISAVTRRLHATVVATFWAGALLILALGIYAVWRTARAMRAGDQTFRSLIEHAHDIISIIDFEGRIVFVSPAMRALGYPPEEFEGQVAFDHVHPEDVQHVRETFQAALTMPAAAEYRFQNSDGRWHTVSSRSSLITLPNGDPAVLLNTRDVTEERLLERRLAESERLESVGRLAGGVAHDFNNLITIISATTSILRSESKDPETIEDLEVIKETCERAGRLTGQLLTFARREVLEPAVLDVNALIRDLGPMLRRVANDSVQLEFSLFEGVAAVRGDRTQLDRLIVNLTANAAEAMPDGGSISVSTKHVSITAGERKDLPAGEYIQIDVADTAGTLSEEARAHAFEPFFTTKPEGTGLGLATCYGIVSQNGGVIDVESQPGTGTRFWILWPCAEEEEMLEDEIVVPRLSRGSEIILYAEDEEKVRRVVTRMLEQEGYRVLSACDGVEAHEIARSEPWIDLLLTDVSMPNMGGRELAEAIDRAHPGTPVIYMSGYTEDEDLKQQAGTRDFHFVAKPFDPERFARAVREVLEARSER